MSFCAMFPKISRRPSLQDVFAGFKASCVPTRDIRPTRPTRDARLYHELPRNEQQKRVRWGPPDIKFIDPTDTTKHVRWGPPQVRYIPPRSAAAGADSPAASPARQSVLQNTTQARSHVFRPHHPSPQLAAASRYHPYAARPRQPPPKPKSDGFEIFFNSVDESNWMSDYYSAPFEARLSFPAHTKHIAMQHSQRMRTFTCAAQYILAQKSLFFGDMTMYKDVLSQVRHDVPRLRSLAALLHARHPALTDQAAWARERYGIALAAYTAKFRQNAHLARALARTGRRELVCADRDEVWGVGPDRRRGARGQNVGGHVLMEVRELLARR